jgi:hypothetical protein
MRGVRSSRQHDSGDDTSASGNRPLLIIIAAVLAVALVVAVTTFLVLRDDESATPSGPDPVATPTTSGSATPSPTQEPSPSPTEEPTQRPPSAAEDLGPFFAAAVTLDQQLQTAAAAINATGPPWEQISADVASKVRAADLRPVSRAIPAGLPHDLQQAVILVLSDLTSRRMAMESFTSVGPIFPDDSDVAHATTAQLLAELQNGHAAAVRFDGDLAAARALAAASAPVAPVPRQSRLTAEVLILVEYVRVANAGCDARGGAVFTTLPKVTWRSVPHLPEAEGTVDVDVTLPEGNATVVRTEFNADLRPNGTWDVYLFVC